MKLQSCLLAGAQALTESYETEFISIPLGHDLNQEICLQQESGGQLKNDGEGFLSPSQPCKAK